jgi:hypothetical protein
VSAWKRERETSGENEEKKSSFFPKNKKKRKKKLKNTREGPQTGERKNTSSLHNINALRSSSL